MYDSIILSGLPGSGKSTLLAKLKDVLLPEGWKFHSIGDYFKAKHRELHPNNEVPFDVWWPTTTPEINREVNDIAFKLMKQGKLVLDSRFSVAYREGLNVCAFFLTAPLEVRAQRLFAARSLLYAGKDVPGIMKTLQKREQDEYVRGQSLFGETFDYRNPKLYDLILDAGVLTVEQETEQILTALEKSSSRKT